ncbi:hypothetical protein LTR70_006964 [Exophiala xenobiotica]|nr:hypothetical protein LTR70_006964 [Exophiala xenobiotica]
MVLLEIIIIGGAVYYYKKQHKVNKARKAAFLAGHPFYERGGSVSYPPSYPGLSPCHSSLSNKVQYGGPREQTWSDAPVPVSVNEKAPLVTETRDEIMVSDEKI